MSFNKISVFLIIFTIVGTMVNCYDAQLEQAKILANQSDWSLHLTEYINQAVQSKTDSETILKNVRNLNNDFIKKQVTSCNSNGCIDIDASIFVNEFDTIIKKKIKDIQKGDYVETSNGFNQVYFVYEHNYTLNLINIKTESNDIAVTPNHIIPILRNDQLVNVIAQEITIGDVLQKIDNSGDFENDTVIDISIKSNPTKYILTYNDDIIVNNILVSCHVDYHHGGYYMTYPLRWIYAICDECVNQDTYFIQGMKYIYQGIFH